MLEDLVARYPDHELAWLALLSAYSTGLGFSDEQFEVLERGVAAIPASGPLHNLLGYAYMSIENWPLAVQHFESCLKFYPMLDEIHLHLVKCYRAAGDHDAANRHQALHDEKSKKKR